MQLIAIDETGERIIAPQAKKKNDYQCPTCDGLVRLRCGPHIQAHFYHYRKPKQCVHRKKTQAHLHNQLYLASKLKCAILEHPFPSIGRIADVFWPAQNIVFEIQYSAMTAEEAKKRESDYSSLGVHLVWIIHEARFNRRRLSAAEQFFVTRHTYYTSIDARGIGMIYDQFEIIRGEERCFKGAKFPIHPASPYRLHDVSPPNPFPKALLQRLQTRSLGFAGDVIDATFQKPDYDYSSLIALESRYSKRKISLFSWMQACAPAYRAFIYALLEKTLIK